MWECHLHGRIRDLAVDLPPSPVAWYACVCVWRCPRGEASLRLGRRHRDLLSPGCRKQNRIHRQRFGSPWLVCAWQSRRSGGWRRRRRSRARARRGAHPFRKKNQEIFSLERERESETYRRHRRWAAVFPWVWELGCHEWRERGSKLQTPVLAPT